MENASCLDAVLAMHSPLLPPLWLERGYLSLAWGLVLAAAAVAGVAWRGQGRRLAWLPVLLLLLCWLPGALSPAYWLGLAFRAPSLSSTLLCGWVVMRHYRAHMPGPAPQEVVRVWAPVLTLLGWVLLLDTFALWPVSLYAAGFAPLTLGGLALLGLLPWLLRGAWTLSALLMTVCLLYLVLRLPSGNVWDALLDPWLWLLVQMDWVWRLWARRQR